MKMILSVVFVLSASNTYALVAPSAICNSNGPLKNMATRMGKSCANIKIKDIQKFSSVLYPSDNNSADVCGRNPGVVAGLLKALGKSSCREVNPIDLAGVDELYVEGNGKNPVRSLRTLTYRDLRGLYNTTALVFEYTYLETIIPGAFADMRSVSNIEISHNRVSYLHPETFCKEGAYGLPSLRTLDLDSNRPFKNGTVEENLLSCLGNLTEVDFDTDFITHFPRGLFSHNKNLKNIDVKNNVLSNSEQEFLKSVNGGSVTVELGTDVNDVMETWQEVQSI